MRADGQDSPVQGRGGGGPALGQEKCSCNLKLRGPVPSLLCMCIDFGEPICRRQRHAPKVLVPPGVWARGADG
eukprot:4728495-Alexandrium_andersonii.AAC.1